MKNKIKKILLLGMTAMFTAGAAGTAVISCPVWADEVIRISGVQNPVWKEKSKYDEFMDAFSSKVTNLIMSELSLKVR